MLTVMAGTAKIAEETDLPEQAIRVSRRKRSQQLTEDQYRERQVARLLEAARFQCPHENCERVNSLERAGQPDRSPQPMIAATKQRPEGAIGQLADLSTDLWQLHDEQQCLSRSHLR